MGELDSLMRTEELELMRSMDRPRRLRILCWAAPGADEQLPAVLAVTGRTGGIASVGGDDSRLLQLGPRDWLAVGSRSGLQSVESALEKAASHAVLSVTDVSDTLATYVLRGPRARDLLAKGSAVDFHPRVFAAGRCARTRFAQVPVVIECGDGGDNFALHVPQSYGYYLGVWLADAALEYRATAP